MIDGNKSTTMAQSKIHSYWAGINQLFWARGRKCLTSPSTRTAKSTASLSFWLPVISNVRQCSDQCYSYDCKLLEAAFTYTLDPGGYRSVPGRPGASCNGPGRLLGLCYPGLFHLEDRGNHRWSCWYIHIGTFHACRPGNDWLRHLVL